jgi:hypothetical protein
LKFPLKTVEPLKFNRMNMIFRIRSKNGRVLTGFIGQQVGFAVVGGRTIEYIGQ